VGSPALAGDQYGAIAYSPDTGALGYSSNFPSQQAAENDALLRCQSAGTGCKTAIWFRNACAALALSTNGNGYGSGWSANRGKAERLALASCREANADCYVARWVCASSADASITHAYPLPKPPTTSRQVPAERARPSPGQGAESTSFEILKGFDLPSDDYRSGFSEPRLKGISKKACRQECSNDDRCRAFTFNVRARVCFLKASVPGRTPFAGAVSGIKVANREVQPTVDAASPAFQDQRVQPVATASPTPPSTTPSAPNAPMARPPSTLPQAQASSPVALSQSRTTGRQPKVDAVSMACSGAASPGSVADCLFEAAKAETLDNLNEPAAYLKEVYYDVGHPDLPFQCRQAIQYMNMDLDVLRRGYAVEIPFKASTCDDAAAVYKAMVGRLPRWTSCPPGDYSYERLEACITPIFSEDYTTELTNLWGRVTDNKSGQKPKFVFETLSRLLENAKGEHEIVARRIRGDAVECENEDGRPPRQISEQYGVLVSSGTVDGSEIEVRKAVDAAITCADAVKLGKTLPSLKK
jgi:Domain of unknown function (DUF4189)/PAN domain